MKFYLLYFLLIFTYFTNVISYVINDAVKEVLLKLSEDICNESAEEVTQIKIDHPDDFKHPDSKDSKAVMKLGVDLMRDPVKQAWRKMEEDLSKAVKEHSLYDEDKDRKKKVIHRLLIEFCKKAVNDVINGKKTENNIEFTQRSLLDPLGIFRSMTNIFKNPVIELINELIEFIIGQFL